MLRGTRDATKWADHGFAAPRPGRGVGQARHLRYGLKDIDAICGCSRRRQLTTLIDCIY